MEKRAATMLSRRQFLARTAVAGAAVAAGPVMRAAKPSGASARVAIIGAGLAGLTCAYRLKQAGVDATVYEASARVGGRCWTRRDDFDGQIAEHGGELIDQGHTAIRHLAQELKLPLDNLLAAEPSGTEAFFYFGGGRYSYRDATNDLKSIWKKLHRDLSEASFPTLYNQSTPRGRELDQMSIVDWIKETVPGGLESRLGQLLDVGYNIEYGAETGEQSALNLLYLLGYNSPGQFNLFGASNEKYHVRGGNDRIVSTLQYVLGNQIQTGETLVCVKRMSGGGYTLTFDRAQGAHDVVADKVVFALPFSVLNTAVNTSLAGLSELKRKAIKELPMGSNSKLNVGFSRRHWVAWGGNGDSFAETGYQASWEVSRGQPGTSGILVNYSGGVNSETFANKTAASCVDEFLTKIEPVFPGLGGFKNGRATLDHWGHTTPLVLGSYAYFKPGQYTTFAGIEGVQEGNAHFCGEHTSIESQGYLNGAVETGERVAAEITADLKV